MVGPPTPAPFEEDELATSPPPADVDLPSTPPPDPVPEPHAPEQDHGLKLRSRKPTRAADDDESTLGGDADAAGTKAEDAEPDLSAGEQPKEKREEGKGADEDKEVKAIPWYEKGMYQLYVKISTRDAKGNSTFKWWERSEPIDQVDRDEYERFKDYVVNDMQISYNTMTLYLDLYCVYVSYARAFYCPPAPLLTDPLPNSMTLARVLLFIPRTLFYLLTPADTQFLTCPTRPPASFLQLCYTIQFAYYFLGLLGRLYPPGSLCYRLERWCTLHLTYIANGSVFLPLWLIPGRSRTPPHLIRTDSILGPARVWGGWILGGAYWGPVLVWWAHMIAHRVRHALLQWEEQHRIAAVDERRNGGVVPDVSTDEDGGMGGGGWTGFYYRQWSMASPALLLMGWELWRAYGVGYMDLGERFGEMIVLPSSQFAEGGDLGHWGVDLAMWPGWIWTWIAVVLPSLGLAVWFNYMSFQNRAVIWRDEKRAEGVVVAEYDGEIKIGIVH